jgi:hypothetical protein
MPEVNHEVYSGPHILPVGAGCLNSLQVQEVVDMELESTLRPEDIQRLCTYLGHLAECKFCTKLVIKRLRFFVDETYNKS